MDKSILVQYCDLEEEIKKIQKRIEKLESQSTIVTDSVQTSSEEFPYTKHNAIIRGVDIVKSNKLNSYKAILKSKYDELLEMQNKVMDFIYSIEDSAIRQIFMHRYIDKMSWIQIQIAMKYNHEDTARKKHDRFLEKN